jgi:hypothetical protein
MKSKKTDVLKDAFAKRILETQERVDIIENATGSKYSDQYSTDVYLSAYDGDIRPLVAKVLALNVPLTVVDRITLAAVLGDEFPKRPGVKQAADAPAKAYYLVTWLQFAFDYPKDAAIERAGELFNVSAKTIRTRMKSAPDTAKILIDSFCAKKVTYEAAVQMQSLILGGVGLPDTFGSNVG